MSHTHHDKTRLLNRIRRLRGQLDAIERVLESDEHACSDVLQQIAAVRGGVNGLMSVMLEGHIRDHIAKPAADESERQADVEQVVSVIRSYLK